jgi:hypothetical protein
MTFNPEFYALVSMFIFLWACFSLFTKNFMDNANLGMVLVKISLLLVAMTIWTTGSSKSPMWQWYIATSLFIASILCNLFVRKRKEK